MAKRHKKASAKRRRRWAAGARAAAERRGTKSIVDLLEEQARAEGGAATLDGEAGRAGIQIHDNLAARLLSDLQKAVHLTRCPRCRQTVRTAAEEAINDGFRPLVLDGDRVVEALFHIYDLLRDIARANAGALAGGEGLAPEDEEMARSLFDQRILLLAAYASAAWTGHGEFRYLVINTDERELLRALLP